MAGLLRGRLPVDGSIFGRAGLVSELVRDRRSRFWAMAL